MYFVFFDLRTIVSMQYIDPTLANALDGITQANDIDKQVN